MDDFLSIKNTKFNIYGIYLQKDGKDYPKRSNIQLINNFDAYLFNRVVDKKNLVKYWMKLITINSGFASKFKGGAHFIVMGNLTQLGLGWFKDQTYPVFEDDMEIIFTINTDDNDLLKKSCYRNRNWKNNY